MGRHARMRGISGRVALRCNVILSHRGDGCSNLTEKIRAQGDEKVGPLLRPFGRPPKRPRETGPLDVPRMGSFFFVTPKRAPFEDHQLDFPEGLIVTRNLVPLI